MRTTVDIPDKIFCKVKATAALRGKRIKDLLEEGLRLALEAPRWCRSSTGGSVITLGGRATQDDRSPGARL